MSTETESPPRVEPDEPVERVAIRPEVPAKKSGLLHNVVFPLVLLAIGAGVVYALGSVEPDQRIGADLSRAGRMKALPPVNVVPIRSLDASGATLQLRVDGTVVPYREARVAAEVAGRVVFKSEVCEAGSYVNKGDLLMRLDATDYELEVQRLSRLQEQEYEALSEVDQEMVNVQRLIELAKEDVELQRNEVNRQNSLPSGFSSRGEVDQATRALLQARQQLVTSENQLDLLRKRRAKLEASERLAATQRKAAEVDLARTEIVAPIDGVIVSEEADLNTFVARGNPLVTIEDTSKVEVATNVRIDQLYWILDQEGRTMDDLQKGYSLPETPALIEFEMSGREGDFHQWEGRLVGYDGIGLDLTTRTVPVRILVDDPRSTAQSSASVGGTALVRGMYVTVKLLIKPRTPMVIVPAEALKPGNRVWEFTADDSVLDDVVQPTSDSNEPTPNSDSNAELAGAADAKARPAQAKAVSDDSASDGSVSDASMADDFDPDRWVAGRVSVRESIIPVDSLVVEGYPGDGYPSLKSSSPRKLWVCESRDGTLVNGSFVVVSPIGGIDSGQLPARTRRSMVDADAAVLESE
tara:strand:+ start:25608 stop:27353 length:1746 start_codon:yes stop_codon:yes gene_type:complete